MSGIPHSRRKVGYLSGALRVATNPEAEAAGPRSHILGTISGFAGVGWDVHPYIVGDKVSSRATQQSGKKTIGRNPFRILLSDLIRIGSGMINSYLAWRTLRGRVDWVYERSSLLQSMGGRFQKDHIPWILESNGLLSYEARDERKSVVLYRLARYIELRAYRKCDALVCVNHELKDVILAETEIDPEKIVVVPNGVDTNFFSPDQTTAIRLFDGFTVGYVGGLIPRQGLDLLIEVIADIQQEQSIPINVTIIGDGIAKSDLEKMTRDMGLEPHVRFLGQVSRNEIPSYIAGFDLGYSGQIVQPIGRMYHSPLKIYEYMAMSIPTIASGFSDAKSVIRHNENGFLFEPGDRESLKEILLFSYTNRFKFEEMGKMARAEVLQNHSWTHRVSGLIERIEDIIGGTEIAEQD